MNLRYFTLLIVIPFIVSSSVAQQSEAQNNAALHSDGTQNPDFLPGGLVFPPIIANVYEGRAGFVIENGEDQLRLDIGASVDVLAWRGVFADGDMLSLGADFFTWTSLREEQDFHFPVDAVDYLFGLNASYSNPLGDDLTLQSRFRLSHISAHLADGRYNKETGEWLDGRLPIVYSREFFEWLMAMDFDNTLRLYLGPTYIYHIDPPDLGKFAFQVGAEVAATDVVNDWLTPYAAYDLRLVKVTEYVANHSAQIGVKFGAWHGRGLNVFIALYNGMSYHGEYYDLRASYWGPGVTVDL